ncbi:sporulation protein YpjB [Falsibacillus albus]|uniref:Sporulation protein YpjB n=1 Tax=Falsibacillus albus TaxID=2478915 RepID=A0A3L7JXX1_9BACI|nr:sporulation protein YpjB [Falsibacillus albus]RLQ95114.1 sporulation protein YpjB [Falsibacillus albus]
MKAKYMIIFAIIISLFTSTCNAKEAATLSSLDKIADQALQLTKSGKYEDAKQMLEYFSDQFTKVSFQDKMLSMDDLRVLTVSHNKALEAVTNLSMPDSERINDVMTFRLVMDALHSKYQPLWTEMERSIMTAFNQVQQAAEAGDQESYHYKLNSFLSQYSIIEPSLKVDISPERLQKLDAKITYLDQYRNVSDNTDQINELNLIHNDLQQLFDQMNQDEADPSIWWVIFSTGGIIIFTLSYVGWRKYKGQRMEKQKKERND